MDNEIINNYLKEKIDSCNSIKLQHDTNMLYIELLNKYNGIEKDK